MRKLRVLLREIIGEAIMGYNHFSHSISRGEGFEFRVEIVLLFWFVAQCQAQVSDSAVVAQVGKYTITARDLLESYEFGPAFVKRYPDPLRKHLDYMVYERLIAFEAEKLGYDTKTFVRERVSALEEDLTVDELYRREIPSKVKLSQKEIEEGIQKARMNLRLRWIFAKTREDAYRVKRESENSVSFDSLFARQLDLTITQASRLYETTLLKLERDNPEFARQISHLRNQGISAPIAGPDGFYVVRVDQIWQNPLMTETEERSLRHQAVPILKQIKADKLAAEYATTKMKAASPVIKAEGFNIARVYIAEKSLSRDTRVRWKIPATFMTEAGPRPISESPKFLSRPLVTFGGRALTVREYIRWFDIRQFQLKTNSLAAFNSSIKQTVWRMVQDKLLSEEAYARGLHLLDTVQHEKKKWEAKLLYLAARTHLMRSVEIPDTAVKTRFEAHRASYGKSAGKRVTFEEVKRDIRYELHHEAFMKVLFRTLQRLKEEVQPHIDEQVVQSLSARLDRNEYPLDVIFYKSGGTFPRRAFPTIDEQWQLFR